MTARARFHRAARVLRAACVAAALATALAACASGPPKLAASEVPDALERAQADLDAGRTTQALDTLRAAANAVGLPVETRERVQRSLELAASRRVDELSAPGADPEELAELVELELPRQIAVIAGLRAARAMFAEEDAGLAVDAYRLIKRLDAKYPQHHERVAAGDLLVEIGMWLIPNGTGWLGIGHSSDDGQEVLEYAVLHHPWATRADEAYAALAKLYEDDRSWRLAIERYELLVLNHPGSRLRPGAQAAIPHLRLRASRSPEYDRSELLKARKELEQWLQAYDGLDSSRQARMDLGDCLRRLADSDMIIARFYRTVGNDAGTRFHAERAVEEARVAGDDERIRRAEALIPAKAPLPSAVPAESAP